MMLNKYYNNCQKKAVEKYLESFEDCRNISFFIHQALTFIFDFFSPSIACMPVSSIYVWKKIQGS